MNCTHILARHSTPISCLDLWYSTRDHYLRLGSYREQNFYLKLRIRQGKLGQGWLAINTCKSSLSGCGNNGIVLLQIRLY